MEYVGLLLRRVVSDVLLDGLDLLDQVELVFLSQIVKVYLLFCDPSFVISIADTVGIFGHLDRLRHTVLLLERDGRVRFALLLNDALTDPTDNTEEV